MFYVAHKIVSKAPERYGKILSIIILAPYFLVLRSWYQRKVNHVSKEVNHYKNLKLVDDFIIVCDRSKSELIYYIL